MSKEIDLSEDTLNHLMCLFSLLTKRSDVLFSLSTDVLKRALECRADPVVAYALKQLNQTLTVQQRQSLLSEGINLGRPGPHSFASVKP